MGGANLRRIHFWVKTYVKMKEIDPVGGGVRAGGAPLDLPMARQNTVTPASVLPSGKYQIPALMEQQEVNQAVLFTFENWK